MLHAYHPIRKIRTLYFRAVASALYHKLPSTTHPLRSARSVLNSICKDTHRVSAASAAQSIACLTAVIYPNALFSVEEHLFNGKRLMGSNPSKMSHFWKTEMYVKSSTVILQYTTLAYARISSVRTISSAWDNRVHIQGFHYS